MTPGFATTVVLGIIGGSGLYDMDHLTFVLVTLFIVNESCLTATQQGSEPNYRRHLLSPPIGSCSDPGPSSRGENLPRQ
jgi:hypothetical protein